MVWAISQTLLKNCPVGILPDKNALSTLAPSDFLTILLLQSYSQHGSMDIFPPPPNHHLLLDFTAAISKTFTEQPQWVISTYASWTYSAPHHWQFAFDQY